MTDRIDGQGRARLHCPLCETDITGTTGHRCPPPPIGGSATSGDPESAQLALPGGRTEELKLLQEPKPTVARIVHYYRTSAEQPLAAIVTAVWGSQGHVELQTFGPTSVVHRSVGYSAFPKGGCWTWPPRV